MNVALALYGIVAAMFVIPTLDEGLRKHLPWNGPRVLGLALSLAWPILVVLGVVLILRDMRRRWAAK
jgi:hypothetical protein